MPTPYPPRSAAEIEDQIARALEVEAGLRDMQLAARHPALVRDLERLIRQQAAHLAWLRELRREVGYLP
jgi:hypothetical protein